MLLLVLLVLRAVSGLYAPVSTNDAGNLTYRSMQRRRDTIRDLHSAFPALSRLEVVGKVAGSPVYVLIISRKPRRPFLLPRVYLLADFPAGSEQLIRLASHLLQEYDQDEAVARVVNGTEVHIIFWLEPVTVQGTPKDDCSADDLGGDELAGFPDYFNDKAAMLTDDSRLSEQAQLLAQWIRRGRFVLGAHLRGGDGDVAVAYGFRNGFLSRNSPIAAPDEDVLRNLSLGYAQLQPEMKKGAPHCPGGHLRGFPGGVTSAAAWKKRPGSVQDYAYVREGTLVLDLAISCCRVPSEQTLRRLWMDNKNAMVHLLREVQRALRGYVKAPDGTHIPGALLTIRGRNVGFRSSDQGEFWRMLLPGTYMLLVSARGYLPDAVSVTVPEQGQKMEPVVVVLSPRLHPPSIVAMESYSTEQSVPERHGGGGAGDAPRVGGCLSHGFLLLTCGITLGIFA
ncbi:carboxypeptidase M-like [Haemaphysalis longicornis]